MSTLQPRKIVTETSGIVYHTLGTIDCGYASKHAAVVHSYHPSVQAFRGSNRLGGHRRIGAASRDPPAVATVISLATGNYWILAIGVMGTLLLLLLIAAIQLQDQVDKMLGVRVPQNRVALIAAIHHLTSAATAYLRDVQLYTFMERNFQAQSPGRLRRLSIRR
jgi:hypothetical protein